MANDYISRADLMALVESEYWKYRDEYRATEILEDIEKFPAADVRTVVKARWKPRDLTYGRQYYYCTSCEETVDMPTAMGIPLFNYCPNCGADMKGG